jgi:hypothetical protein
MAGERRRFPWLTYAVILAVIGLFTFSPVILLASAGPGPNGEPLQLADLMAQWGVLGWLLLAPFPIGMFGFGGWLVALVVHLIVRSSQRHKVR